MSIEDKTSSTPLHPRRRRVCIQSVDEHSIVPVQRGVLRLDGDAAAPPGQELAPDLRADLVVAVGEQEVQQGLALVLGDLVPVPLRESQQGLVPDDRQPRPRRRHLPADVHHVAFPDGGRVHAPEAQLRGVEVSCQFWFFCLG